MLLYSTYLHDLSIVLSLYICELYLCLKHSWYLQINIISIQALLVSVNDAFFWWTMISEMSGETCISM